MLVSSQSGATLSAYFREIQRKLTREFSKPIPTREVSLVYGRSFYKEKIVEAIEESIISSLPKGISSLKSKDLQVVDIE